MEFRGLYSVEPREGEGVGNSITGVENSITGEENSITYPKKGEKRITLGRKQHYIVSLGGGKKHYMEGKIPLPKRRSDGMCKNQKMWSRVGFVTISLTFFPCFSLILPIGGGSNKMPKSRQFAKKMLALLPHPAADPTDLLVHRLNKLVRSSAGWGVVRGC